MVGVSAGEVEVSLSAEEIRQMVEEAEGSIDEGSVRSSVQRLRRSESVNAELRLRFPSSPLRFLDSEVELHSALLSVTAVATSPSLYSAFFSSGGLELLTALLSHDNQDIANAAVQALHELLDAETLLELSEDTAQQGMQRLVTSSLHPPLYSLPPTPPCVSADVPLLPRRASLPSVVV